MRTYNWKPEKIKSPEQEKDENGKDVFEEDGITPKLKIIDKESPFEGIVILKVPKYTERLKFMRQCGIGVKDGEIDQLKMVEIGIEHITKVQLTRKENGQVFETTDDLQYDKDGSDVLNSIANDIVSGVRLGEGLNPN